MSKPSNCRMFVENPQKNAEDLTNFGIFWVALNIYKCLIFWLVVSTPLKNMKVSWDDYSQYMENHKIHVPNHQPVLIAP
jgi:membrane protein required for beta-lactamase induction